MALTKRSTGARLYAILFFQLPGSRPVSSTLGNHKENGVSELSLNLISGLLGALIGALATLRAAQWQLRQISAAHADALAHQNDILEQTFQHQREMLAAEQRLRIQLEALTLVHDVVHESAWPVFLEGHQLRNDWAGHIVSGGLEQYCQAVTKFRDHSSQSLREFSSALDICRHFPEIYFPLEKTLQFQSKFFEPIQLFLLALEKLPASPDRGTISLVDTKGKAFSDAVNEYSSWIDSCKNLVFSMKAALLNPSQVKSQPNCQKR